MKLYAGLFDRIASFPNLLAASRRAQMGKRFQRSVAEFNFNLEADLLRLRDELLSGTWRPGEYRRFTVFEPKCREIVAAPYRDRVVHHALCGAVEPLFDRGFIEDSYACRQRKGTHAALDRAHQFLRRSRFVLKCDVRKFFASVDHATLDGLLSRKIACARTLALMRRIIAFGARQRAVGLPIGNLTSQLFANVYLNELDHFVKQGLRARLLDGTCAATAKGVNVKCQDLTPFRYVRYMDDFLVFGESKDELAWAKAQIARFLQDKLKLRLNEKKSFVSPVRVGVSFLGMRLFVCHRRLNGANVTRFARKLAALKAASRELLASAQAWTAHAAHANTWHLRTRLLAGVAV